MKETEQAEQEGAATPFTPDDAWLDAFQAQLTGETVDRARKFARMRALGVANTGRKVDDYYARELVQDAIADTFEGVLRWDPARVTLEAHLTRAVQFRSRDHRMHEIAFPHDALGDGTDESLLAEREASGVATTEPDLEKRRYAAELLAYIRDETAADKPVLRILDAYDAGATTKAEVIAYTKMKARTYHNARIRLGRIVRDLTNRRLARKAHA
jgi:hypothetical protein